MTNLVFGGSDERPMGSIEARQHDWDMYGQRDAEERHQDRLDRHGPAHTTDELHGRLIDHETRRLGVVAGRTVAAKELLDHVATARRALDNVERCALELLG